ncbi:helix-turn-helix transcriptional regulator [Enterococcus faecalis]|nr:helix-turn-helix transcriptional regulator [Enterococcus faecalis]
MKEEKYTLAQLRGMQNMTKEELARRSGVSYPTISSYEKDVENLRNGRYRTIEKVVKALGFRVCDIFTDPDSEKPKKFDQPA